MEQSDEPCALSSLPPELLVLVAEKLDEKQSLANLAAASAMCLHAANGELRAALLASVKKCLHTQLDERWLVPDFWCQGRVSDAQVSCPYFCLPDDLVVLPPGTFRGCALVELTLPTTLTSIGNFVFRLCASLAKLTLRHPTALTHIGNNAFDNCSALAELDLLPATLTSIGNFSFQDCTSLTSLALPATLASIGDGAFEGCEALATFTLPDAIKALGKFVFAGCTSLYEVNLSNLTTIGSYCFHNCTSLTQIILPATLVIVGNGAFRGRANWASNTCSLVLVKCRAGVSLLSEVTCGLLRAVCMAGARN